VAAAVMAVAAEVVAAMAAAVDTGIIIKPAYSK
jgi:hypothetical protein